MNPISLARHYAYHLWLRGVADPAYTVRRLRDALRAHTHRWRGRRAARLDARPVVLFHSFIAKHRLTNQAKALRATGRFHLVLAAGQFDFDEQVAAFDEIHLCRGVGHFLRMVDRIERRAPLHAVVCGTYPISYAESVLDRPRDWPLLVSIYDSYWAMRHFGIQDAGWRHYEREIEAERRVLPRCDGVIGRDGAMEKVFADEGVGTPLLTRSDLCDPDYVQRVPAHPRESGTPWSVVSAGQVYPMRYPEAQFRDAQMVRYADDFRRAGVNLHVYPAPNYPFHCPVYEAERKRNPWFHMHRPLSPGRIRERIARHDFGFMMFLPSPAIPPAYHEHVLTLRLFTYLEAGLPVLCTEEFRAVAGIVREYGCGIVLPGPSVAGLPARMERVSIEDLRTGVRRAREAYDNLHHAPALVEFVEACRTRRSGATSAARTVPSTSASGGEAR